MKPSLRENKLLTRRTLLKIVGQNVVYSNMSLSRENVYDYSTVHLRSDDG